MLAVVGLLVALAAGQASAAPMRPGSRKTVTFAELQKGFRQPDMLYAPFAFWFWDAPVDPKWAAYQATEMCKQRFNPGYAHPRGGLPGNEWLAPAWFQAYGAAVKATEANGGYLGYCDEYDWPSGRAHGKVLQAHPELAAQSLQWKITDVAGGEEAQLRASFFTVAAQVAEDKQIKSGTLQVIGAGDAFTWHAPAASAGAATWRVYSFTKFHHAGLDGSPVNYLDDRLMDVFMPIAYAPYDKALRGHMGKKLCGIFIDNEGDYGWKLAWSDYLARVYKQRTGRDIRLWMPLMVDRDTEGVWAKARWQWLDVVSDIYASNFFGKINRWAEQRGMYCTMHVWEESLLLQAEAVGDYFKVMRAVTMPGTDSLMKKPLLPQEFKETQSVSEFENQRCTCEVLGVVGWDMTPAVLKQTTNAVTAWGVSHVMPHGVYLRKDLNTIPYPPDFFTENPYWPYLHLWTDFTRRASYVTSHGHTVPDVLLLNPMDTLWATIGDWLLAPKPGMRQKVEQINGIYFDALKRLTDARVEFLVTDRHYLGEMAVQPGGTLALGDFRFKAMVIPPVMVLPLETARKILAFAKAGGAVYCLGELPTGSSDNGMGDPEMARIVAELKGLPSVVQCEKGLAGELARPGTKLVSQITFESGEFAMVQSHRRIDGRDFFWLANQGDTARECSLRVAGVAGGASLWDCETGAVRPVASEPAAGGTRVKLTFQPYEAYFLVFDPKAPAGVPAPPAAPPAKSIPLDGDWTVSIPRAGQPALEPEAAKLFTVPWQAAWLKVDGTQRFRHEFELPAAPVRATLKVTADETFSLYVNGKAVPHRSWDDLWQQVSLVDATKLLAAGKNVIAVRASKGTGQGGLILQGEIELPGGKKVTLATGPEWRTSPDEPSAARTGFDKWIWHPTMKESQTIYLRREFSLPDGAQVARANVTLTCDNRSTLYVNGKKFPTNEPWMEPATYDVKAALRPGRNLLAVQAQNDDGAAGFLALLQVQLADGKSIRVSTDGEWRASEAAGRGWTAAGYDDSKWVAAKVVGDYGGGPWGTFNDEALQGAPAWAALDYDAGAWKPAEALGVPPLAPWIDVPPALVAGEKRPLGSWSDWGLNRFSGYVDYAHDFELPAGAGKVTLDLGKVQHTVEVSVNGKKAGERLWPPFVFDITAACRPGTNSVRVRVGNLMTNEMAQFADRKKLGTWGWGPAPGKEAYDAGLLGPVAVRVE